jgi:putative transposase
MVKQYLTCAFKLHNPSAHKRAVIEHALHEYTVAYQEVLDRAQDDEGIRENGRYKGKYTGKSVAEALPRPKAEMHSSAIDSLLLDVGGNLASYYELLEQDFDATSYPTARDPSPEAEKEALDHFIAVGADQGDYDQARARLLRQTHGRFMPVFFRRADGASQTKSGAARNRNFSLVADERGRLFAVLYLLPAGHDLGRPLGATQGNLYRLDTGEVFKSNSKAAILVPLQVGRNGWQLEKFVRPARDSGDVSVKTAFLLKDERAGEYYLHVAFEFTCPEPYSPEAYLGVDMGILFTAAYALVDGSGGAVIDIGHFDDELRALQIKHGRERERLARGGKRVTWRHYKTRAYDNILHALANNLVEMAKARQAGVVIENLNVQVRGGRVKSRFRKFGNILEYKCRLVGVPFRRVFAAWSSMICHKCGETMERDDRLVTCPACGYEGHSDDNAAVNIARRAMYRKRDWAGGYREFHRSFANVGGF